MKYNEDVTDDVLENLCFELDKAHMINEKLEDTVYLQEQEIKFLKEQLERAHERL